MQEPCRCAEQGSVLESADLGLPIEQSGFQPGYGTVGTEPPIGNRAQQGPTPRSGRGPVPLNKPHCEVIMCAINVPVF